MEENQFVGNGIGVVDLERAGDCSSADRLTLAYLSVALGETSPPGPERTYSTLTLIALLRNAAIEHKINNQ